MPSGEHQKAGDVPLDDVDLALIHQLQRDGRASYADLGEAVGLSPAGARKRVMRLLDSNVVRVLGVVDPFTVGANVAAMVSLRCDGPIAEAAEALTGDRRVVWASIISGRFDLMTEVVCDDTDELVAFTEELRALPHVCEVEVTIVLDYLVFDQSRARTPKRLP
jgi:Lrp/AsnC family transcriptional regulator for asnA, asnC and gidA